ncbi:MAG: SusC/RagA family TonB-linked outer membrane protein [Cyclobacteriaceae bacterium]|jgi:TonB-linked SusC/RagA family outer membrane protein|nr:SusC/RagA family TonB-linked outer membrane protein [Cyclobacteriaceae bacterium]
MKKFLLLCSAVVLTFSISWAQERTVSGRVTSAEDGTALPGVNVVVKGTTNGTVTDSDGNFKLSVPSANSAIVFSFIGLRTEEIVVGERTVIDVALTLDVTQLTEVVVTAQGIQQEKRAVGYAVASVSGNTLTQKPETDVARILNGKVPGVNITSTGGTSGTGTNIIIRGYTTISGSKQPLFVVDGVPFNSDTNTPGADFASGNQVASSRFLDLDPNNIERVDVLKGLSAAVLYGEQGRNGVIVITTKNVTKKKEKLSVDLTQSYFVNEIASLPNYQDNYGNGFQQNFGFFFSNWGPRFDTRGAAGIAADGTVDHPYSRFSDASLLAAFPEFQGARYQYKAYDNNRFFQQGGVRNTSITVGGGNEKTSYNATFSGTNEEGFIPGNELKKRNLGLGINSELSKKFSMQTSFNFASTEVDSPPISAGLGSGSVSSAVSIFGDVLYTPRSIDLMGLPFEAPDGRSVYYRSGNDIQNPRWTAKYTAQTDDVKRFQGSNLFVFKANDKLNFSYRTGLDTYSGTQEYIVNRGGPNIPIGLYRSVFIENTIWNHDLIGNYSTTFGQDISFTATIGANARLDEYKQNGIESSDQVVFGLINHDNFRTQSGINSFTGVSLQYNQEFNRYGLYGSFSAGYKDYVYLNISGRQDWASTVEENNNSIFYPSVSASFIPTTAFGLESDVLNYIKIRAGYATSAGFPTPYNTRNFLGSSARGFIRQDGTVVTSNSVSNFLGNPNLKPELQEETEIGIEAQFLNKRLGIDLTLYSRDTKDLITAAPLDPSTGFTVTNINVGRISNKGIELGLTGTPVQTGELKWDLTFNFSLYRSFVEELGSGLTQVQVPGGAFTNLGNFAIEDQPFNVILGSTVVREPSTGKRLVGADGNYVVSDDIGIIGNPNPDWTSALISTLSWKGFALSAQLDYRHGGDIYSTTIASLLGRGVTKDTDITRENTFILDGVQADGSPNTVQITSSNYYFDNVGFGASELQMYDGTTIRLREISLSYNLPSSLVSKTPFKKVSLSLSGQNLWFNAINTPKHINFDTDVLSTGVGNGLGFDFLTGPSSRRYGATLSITL